jgi:hypothetical protein
MQEVELVITTLKCLISDLCFSRCFAAPNLIYLVWLLNEVSSFAKKKTTIVLSSCVTQVVTGGAMCKLGATAPQTLNNY